MQRIFSAALLGLGLVTVALAQSGGSYRIRKSTIDSGGETSASGATAVRGTIGQHDATATLTAGALRLRGGFWAAPALPLPDAIFKNGFE